MGCVYRLVNTVNDTVYIGMTTKTAEFRFKQHKQSAEKGKHQTISRAIRKHGPENFDIEILFESESRDILLEKEKEFISINKSFGARTYNMTDGGDGLLGVVYTEEKRAKASAITKGLWKNPEYREKATRNRAFNASARWGNPEFRKSTKITKLTDELVLAIKEACESGRVQAHVAAEFDVTPRTVNLIMSGQQWGVVTGLPYSRPRPKPYKVFTHEDSLEMKRLHDEGKSLREIAKIFDTSHGCVSSRIKQL